jgi:hypothetical protein
MRNRRQNSEGGYAVLMVFLMAAIVALMLYQQMPRVAFESERDKEQLLIDRGEQYTRAIQLYYMANNRQYPTSIDDLEKKEKRFLRKRYVDPFTGKDEWRIVHTNGGFLTDSLVQKPPTGTGTDSQSQSASNTPATPTDGQPQVNAAVLQRPSDRPLTPTPGFGSLVPNQDPSAQGNNTALPPITLQPQQGQGALPPITLQAGGPNQPGGLPPITLAPVGGTGGQQTPGQIPGQFVPPALGQNPGQIPGQVPGPQFPGQPGPGGLPGGIQTGVPPGFRIDPNGQLVPTAQVPGQTLGQPGQPQGIPGQPQGIPGQIFGQQPGQSQPQFPNQQPNQPAQNPGDASPALTLINQLLTNPRQPTATPGATGGNQVGAIAGIASTHKGPSIKVYKDQSQYQLWEFVFSPTASTVPGGGAQPTRPPTTPTGAPPTFGGGGPTTFGPGPGR